MQNFAESEKKILGFWQKNKIFEKSVATRPRSRQFVFYEGPPTANAKPGLHHILARVYKDIICRYKTMAGFQVQRKAGWDTHGLPVELEIEKKLGLKSKKDIEKYGIARFNKKCKASVWQYKKDWEDLTERIGYWLDLKDPYITYEPEYIETVWWLIKQIWQKGLLGLDYKVVPWCPRCGTALSSHEVAQGYKSVKEKSIYVKFNLKSPRRRASSLGGRQISNLKTTSQNSNLKKPPYVLVWTTTPWTLPANVALAVHPQGKYKNLIGLEYEPLYPNEGPHKVLGAEFVSEEEGTGVVHIAPAYGQDDLSLAQKEGLPVVHTVDEQGRYKNNFITEASELIIADLAKRGLLEKTEWIEHEYPFCWRCDSPLIYYARQTWFIKMTELKDRLLKNNQKINWIPSHLKEGRFGEWLKEVKDWALSRERYWGTPLPVWLCQTGKIQNENTKCKIIKKCKNIKVIGSIQELAKLSGKKLKDLHRPFIDKIVFKCEKCGGTMKKIREVIDCWFDSGAMPFAQAHFPFAGAKSQISPKESKLPGGQANLKSQNYKELIKKILFPADYITEAVDQTRGWFYTLLAISTALGFGPPYKNVISLGHVLDQNGEKMSKSRGNVVDPWLVIEKWGADTLRWYFFSINQPGDSKLFAMRDVENCFKKFTLTLWNCFTFFSTYVIHFKRSLKVDYRENNARAENILDRWVISRLNGLIKTAAEKLDNYDVTFAVRTLEDFVVNDLSLWYIRRSRQRFQNPQSPQEKQEAAETLHSVLLTLAKLIAPMMPFLAEEIYQELKTPKMPKSVHLCNWPGFNEKTINKKLEEDMAQARALVSRVLAKRAELRLNVRQPIASAKFKIQNSKFKITIQNPKLLDLIREEVNVRNMEFVEDLREDLVLDTVMTKELREEGMVREIIRSIQDLRKKAGLTPQDRVVVYYATDKGLAQVLLRNQKTILTTTRAKELRESRAKRGEFLQQKEIAIDNQVVWLAISGTVPG